MSMAVIPKALERVGIVVLERGWLSSNNVLIRGRSGPTVLVDSGYATHADQTLALLDAQMGQATLNLLLNTHLHSDHCGGNAALQQRYAGLKTLIPPGQADAVAAWDMDALSYAPTGQQCPRFHFDGLLKPGDQLNLGDWRWQVHGAKGHDPHSVVLFQPEHGVLISADALWQNGFGVVFPELEGKAAFDEVGQTLDLIEQLAPKFVVPGHGSVFTDVKAALKRGRSRLARFKASPASHLRHAQKVLIKFRLLEWQSISRKNLGEWVQTTPYLQQFMPKEAAETQRWLDQLLEELERDGALRMQDDLVINH